MRRLDEDRLLWMQLAVHSDALGRSIGRPVDHSREHQTGVDAPALQQHGASSALVEGTGTPNSRLAAQRILTWVASPLSGNAVQLPRAAGLGAAV